MLSHSVHLCLFHRRLFVEDNPSLRMSFDFNSAWDRVFVYKLFLYFLMSRTVPCTNEHFHVLYCKRLQGKPTAGEHPTVSSWFFIVVQFQGLLKLLFLLTVHRRPRMATKEFAFGAAALLDSGWRFIMKGLDPSMLTKVMSLAYPCPSYHSRVLGIFPKVEHLCR